MNPQSFEQWMRDQTATLAPPKPTYDDSWRDIAGYAQLVVTYLDSTKEGS